MTLDFAVYGKLRNDDNEDVVNSLDSHPTAGKVVYHETLAKQLGRKGHTVEEINELDLDFILTIGGDGTILRLLQKTDKNILGINTGKVGFLTAMEIHQIDKALNLVDNGDYSIDERIKLEVLINDELKGECTNECVVHTDSVAKIRSFEVYQDGNEIDWFRADGLIVSTPTGSTCYAMSAGGPIVDPTVEAFIIVPISPYKLATKPYVVPVDREIDVKITEKNKSCLMVLDGQKKFKVSSDDKLSFRLSDKKASFISFKRDFYSRIRKKLVWK